MALPQGFYKVVCNKKRILWQNYFTITAIFSCRLEKSLMKKIVGLIVFILLLVVGWFFASPYYTLYQLKNAYDSHDVTAINQHINFPSIQTDIKNQLQPVLVKKAQSITQSPFAKLLNIQIDENAMVGKLVTQAVDNGVTPDTVNTVLTTQGNLSALNNNAKLLGGLTAMAMDKIKLNPETLVDLATAKSTDELNQKLLNQVKASDIAKGGEGANSKPTAGYCGLNCFSVQTQVQGYPLTLQMARQGFSNWQIVGVKLPI